MTRGHQEKLSAAANPLNLNTIYEDLFSKQNVNSIYERECAVLHKHHKIGNGSVRKLCNKLVYFLEEIAKTPDEKIRDDRCSYLTHWLYEKIGEIHKKNTTLIDEIPFATEIINVGQKVSKQISGNKCNLGHDVGVSLNDLNERKMLFTYFKKYENIKNSMKSIKPDECDKYDKYINNINSIYKTYKSKICNRYLSRSSIPDYFVCDEQHDPSTLLPLVAQCKSKGPITHALIGNRSYGGYGTYGGYGELEDSASEDEAGSGSDEDDDAVGSESGDEDAEAEAGEDEREDVVLFTNTRGRGKVALTRRRVSEMRELDERSRTGGTRGVQSRITLRSQSHDSEQEQLSRVTSQETEVVQDTSEAEPHSFTTYFYYYLNTAYSVLKSKYFRYSFIAFSMLLIMLVMHHYYKSIKPSGSSMFPKRKRKGHKSNNHEADRRAEEITNGTAQRAYVDPRFQQMNLSYQPTQNYQR
ncbi:variable surface protein Vir12 [Plasmodium vivax India VII]|uniref:Variable surface protein Vir12 n=1 Tax=Plasmodium vivax India VII TaxID=1077284 RepID=A0A0J9SIE7_PLAVI|nr:variable surface protein Vir12 [Plasmodium vivax India VII]